MSHLQLSGLESGLVQNIHCSVHSGGSVLEAAETLQELGLLRETHSAILECYTQYMASVNDKLSLQTDQISEPGRAKYSSVCFFVFCSSFILLVRMRMEMRKRCCPLIGCALPIRGRWPHPPQTTPTPRSQRP